MIVSDPSRTVQPGDLAHCTSASALAFGIRLRETLPKFWLTTKLDISTHTAVVMEIEECGVKKLGLLEMIPNGNKKSACQFTPFSNYLNQGNGGDRIICITRHPAMWQSDVRIAFCKEALSLWAAGEPYDTTGCLKWAFSFLKDVPNAYYCSEYAEHCALVAGFSYYRDKAYKYDVTDDNVMPWPLQLSKFTNTVLK
jgi:hypothetical protein